MTFNLLFLKRLIYNSNRSNPSQLEMTFNQQLEAFINSSTDHLFGLGVASHVAGWCRVREHPCVSSYLPPPGPEHGAEVSPAVQFAAFLPSCSQFMKRLESCDTLQELLFNVISGHLWNPMLKCTGLYLNIHHCTFHHFVKTFQCVLWQLSPE